MNSKLFLLSASITLVISSTLYHINFPFYSAQNDDELQINSRVIPIGGSTVGPECFAFDSNGEGPYTGVSDGRIIKWQEEEDRWVDFAVTAQNRNNCEGLEDPEKAEHVCGRPLGLKFNERSGDLYIADAYMGLLVVGPNGGLATKVSEQANGLSFKFANGLDIDQRSGVIYFSDSSSNYERRDHISIIISGDATGRLMKYNPKRDETTVLLSNLSFPNGVALSENDQFILIAETSKCRILKLWLDQSPKAGNVEVFAQLSGFPDNIKRNQKGEFWVGIHSRRGKFLERVLSYPWIGNVLTRLPIDFTKMTLYLSKWIGHGLAVKLGEEGEILEILEDRNGKVWKCVSEVEEKNGYLWIGSVKMPFVVKQRKRVIL